MSKARGKLVKGRLKSVQKKIIGSSVKTPKKVKAKILPRRPKVTGKKTVVSPEPAAVKKEQPSYIPAPSSQHPAHHLVSQPHQGSGQLPSGYGDNRIVLLTRDPYWLYTYWEISYQKKELARQELGDTYNRCRLILRVYDVTNIIFTGSNAHNFFDIGITDETNNWYINVGKPGRSYCVDIGLLTPDGKFILLARSNVAKTPLDRPSDIIDEEWMVVQEDFQKLYALSVLGFGSSPVGIKKKLAQRLKMELASGAVPSMFSPVGKEERKFWLVVNTELIVYGATEPNASVTVQGQPIKLNKDGTFSLRFVLPNGAQVIPVKAVSFDKKDQRTITPVVSKETK